MTKNLIFSVLTCLAVIVSASAQQNGDTQKMNRFIASLMSKMTLEEKLGQLNLITPFSRTGPFATKNPYTKLKDGSAGNIYSVLGSPNEVHSKVILADSTRLKIPFLNGLDIIHGFKTIFPIPLGLSCTWDTTLIEKTARVAAIEATSTGYNWTFSPMVDITRDPRWGRVMEGSGEDPYLGGLIARAMVKGYQGKNLNDKTSLMACVKHFGLYGAAEAGRDYNTTDMGHLTMYQTYLRPYKAAIEAGAGSIMTSFNEIDGIPATANKWLLTDILRKEWGFKGFVVTDFNAIQELIAHGVAEDYTQAAELALNAGVDMDMASESMVASFEQSLKEKKVSMQEIDAACRRVLEAKYELGLFDNPYKNYDPNNEKKITLTPESKKIAKEAALKSIVLLKNDNHILPLSKNAKIALIGPSVNDQSEMLSMWVLVGESDSVVTFCNGIKKQNPNVTFSEGTLASDNALFIKKTHSYYDENEQQKLEASALEIAKKSDVVVVVLGESKAMFGEAKSKADISLPACQKSLLKALKATGKPVVLVLANGRPLTIEEDLPYADAVLETWRLGNEAGNALADVLFGAYNPSGKLTMTFPRSVGQIPIYYNHKNTGRPYTEGKKETFVSNYIDMKNSPLFPFGFGLSYTTFAYDKISLSDTLLVGSNKTLKVTIRVTNTGKYAGEETVQLYLNDPVASVTRPVKELKKFQKVYLQPGETKVLTFPITTEDLKFYNSQLNWDWESGKFNLFIGTNSEDVKQAGFVWKK
jgi:Beta-glucosidase-related glycosidases